MYNYENEPDWLVGSFAFTSLGKGQGGAQGFSLNGEKLMNGQSGIPTMGKDFPVGSLKAENGRTPHTTK